MGFISRHIMPLVINSLGGRHTHTHKHTHTDVRTGTISRNQARAGLRPAHAWFKNTNIVLKKWAGFYAEGGKNEDTWHQFLRHDKCVGGTCISKLE